MSNLKIWETLQATDPAFTSNFQTQSGFRGTAINPTYQIRKLTEMFGPVGIGWGYEVLDERFQQGAPLFGMAGEIVAHEQIHIAKVKLWYVYEGNRGEATHFGQTMFVGCNASGIYTDEDAPKKSLTDALMKAASMLGCGADVFTGMYEDVKYVAALKSNPRPTSSVSMSVSSSASASSQASEVINGAKKDPAIDTIRSQFALIDDAQKLSTMRSFIANNEKIEKKVKSELMSELALIEEEKKFPKSETEVIFF